MKIIITTPIRKAKLRVIAHYWWYAFEHTNNNVRHWLLAIK